MDDPTDKLRKYSKTPFVQFTKLTFYDKLTKDWIQKSTASFGGLIWEKLLQIMLWLLDGKHL